MTVEEVLALGTVPEDVKVELEVATAEYLAACDSGRKHRKETRRWEAAKNAVMVFAPAAVRIWCPTETAEEFIRSGYGAHGHSFEVTNVFYTGKRFLGEPTGD